MTTIGEAISGVRNILKSVKIDAFLTDRLIYSLLKKHSRWLVRREDSSNKIMKISSLFHSINFVELIEIDSIDVPELGLRTGVTIKRTAEKVPSLMDGYFGPLIRSVTSIDRGISLVPVYPSVYEQISKQKTFRFNTKKYYWFLDGYLYFPNIQWDAVRIEGLFENDLSFYTINGDEDCRPMQQRKLTIPEFLLGEATEHVRKELFTMLQIPSDQQNDNKHIVRP